MKKKLYVTTLFIGLILLGLFFAPSLRNSTTKPPVGWVLPEELAEDPSIEMLSLYPGEEVKFPKLSFQNREEVSGTFPLSFAPSFVMRIPNGRVHGRDGDVLTPGNRILLQTSLHVDATFRDDADLKTHHLFKRSKLPTLKYRDERVAVIASGASNVYFHWMYDILAKLHLLEKSGVEYDKIYISDVRNAFQKDTVKELGLDPAKLIIGKKGMHIQAKELIVPSLPTSSIAQPKWACDYLRSKFLKESSKKKGRRIYISRNKWPKRRILNEDKLIEVLKKHDFEIVRMEGLPVCEQAELFNSAEWIVSPHGSALTNLSFADPGTRVTELFFPRGQPLCFLETCHILDLPYTALIGETAYRNPWVKLKVKLGFKEKNDDYTIDPVALDRILSEGKA